MEATECSETSVKFYHTTRRHTPEDENLYIRRRKNLEPHKDIIIYLTTLSLLSRLCEVMWEEIVIFKTPVLTI
jgi:hypothetical protein